MKTFRMQKIEDFENGYGTFGGSTMIPSSKQKTGPVFNTSTIASKKKNQKHYLQTTVSVTRKSVGPKPKISTSNEKRLSSR